MADDKKAVEKKCVFTRLMDWLDKKMEAGAKGGSCCSGSKSKDTEKKKCC